MTGNLYFLYNLDDRYYFHTQENLNKVAIDRAAEYTEEDIHAEIVLRLERTVQSTANVKVCPTTPNLVKDSQTLQYVILHPQASLPSREKETDLAREAALKILTYNTDDERPRTSGIPSSSSHRGETTSENSEISSKTTLHGTLS